MLTDPKRTNLRRPQTSFIGREAEKEALEGILRKEGLVTILGPPGIGKTRLAIELGLTYFAKEAPRGGVWFCDLTEAKSFHDICVSVSQALQAPLSSAKSEAEAATQLGAALLGR